MLKLKKNNSGAKGLIFTNIQGASREKDFLEMDVTEQVEGVESWAGGNETRQAM